MQRVRATHVTLAVAIAVLAAGGSCSRHNGAATVGKNTEAVNNGMNKSEDEWKEALSSQQYQVLRCSATEPPFTGKYWDHHGTGVYACAGCGQELFRSEEKFDSGTGWPSFWRAARNGSIVERPDNSHGMRRTEIVCARCGGHLGHLFDDGPQPTGMRYCVNSAALDFQGAEK